MLNIAISNATIPHASDASTAPISTTNAPRASAPAGHPPDGVAGTRAVGSATFAARARRARPSSARICRRTAAGSPTAALPVAPEVTKILEMERNGVTRPNLERMPTLSPASLVPGAPVSNARDCVAYSFGIANVWVWDEAMLRHGCSGESHTILKI